MQVVLFLFTFVSTTKANIMNVIKIKRFHHSVGGTKAVTIEECEDSFLRVQVSNIGDSIKVEYRSSYNSIDDAERTFDFWCRHFETLGFVDVT